MPSPGVQKIVDYLLQDSIPAKVVKGALSGLALPGDVYAGRTAMVGSDGRTNPEVIDRAADLGGMVMGGTYAGIPARMAGEAVFGAGPIRAYHGSPHDFDKFDISKIGTGEGAQAYGHGLYFAEKEGVARAYRDQLAPQKLDGKMVDDLLAKHKDNVDAALADLASQEASVAISHPHMAPRMGSVFQGAKDMLTGKVPTQPGRMYQVNIHADPAKMLDWDKPLSAQPEVLKSLRGNAKHPEDWVPDPNVTGSQYWASLQGGPADRRGFLTDQGRPNDPIGIPGIKYLDQGSRSAGDGSRNYVMFDDSLIEIMRKYGMAGIFATPAVAGAASQTDY